MFVVVSIVFHPFDDGPGQIQAKVGRSRMKLFDKELFKVRGINVQTFSLHNLEINWSELDTKPKRNTE